MGTFCPHSIISATSTDITPTAADVRVFGIIILLVLSSLVSRALQLEWLQRSCSYLLYSDSHGSLRKSHHSIISTPRHDVLCATCDCYHKLRASIGFLVVVDCFRRTSFGFKVLPFDLMTGILFRSHQEGIKTLAVWLFGCLARWLIFKEVVEENFDSID